MLKAHENDIIAFLGLAVSLKMISCCLQMFNIEESVQCREICTDDFSTILGKCVRENAVMGQPTIKEDIRNMHGCCLGRCVVSMSFGSSNMNRRVTYSGQGEMHCTSVELRGSHGGGRMRGWLSRSTNVVLNTALVCSCYKDP